MNRIKELRTAKYMSQNDLAKAINVHQTAISQWETNRTNPDMSMAMILADYFDVTTDYLLGRTDFSNKDNLVINGVIIMSIGAKIKSLRNLRGMTQEQLAKASNISRTYLADVECERYNPSIETLQFIAKALDVEISEFADSNTSNPDIRLIARAGRKMTGQQAEQLRRYAQYMFPEAFIDD